MQGCRCPYFCRKSGSFLLLCFFTASLSLHSQVWDLRAGFAFSAFLTNMLLGLGCRMALHLLLLRAWSHGWDLLLVPKRGGTVFAARERVQWAPNKTPVHPLAAADRASKQAENRTCMAQSEKQSQVPLYMIIPRTLKGRQDLDWQNIMNRLLGDRTACFLLHIFDRDSGFNIGG